MIKKFSVPDPCHEQWDGMQPQQNGRYCGSCQKVVIDFTNKTEQEIIDYIAANVGKKMCGTFKTTQLTNTDTVLPFQKHKLVVRFLAAALLVFGMSLFSCTTGEEKSNDQQQEIPFTTTGIMIAPVDTSMQSLQKDTVIKRTKTTTHSVCNTTTGIIAPPVIYPTDTLVPPPLLSEADSVPDDIVTGVISDPMPEFEGGNTALLEYIQYNLKYPETDDDVQGTVYISFIVRSDGNISDVKLLRGIGKRYDEEAMRVIRSMPKWKPGMNHGKPVDIRFNLPIRFRLK